MQRTRRVSRPLIAGLAVLMVLGSFFYLHHTRSTRAEVARVVSKPGTSTDAPSGVDASLASDVRKPEPTVVDSNTASVIPGALPGTLITQTPGFTSGPPAEIEHTGGQGASTALASTTKPASVANKLSSAADSAPTPTPAAPPAAKPVILSGTPLADARSKSDGGDLLAARDILNAALASGKLSSTDADTARTMCGDINKTLIFSPRKFSDDPWALGYPVQSGEHLSTIASKNQLNWELLSRVNGIEPKKLRSGTTIKLIKGPFYAVVTKSAFRLDVYLGAPDGTNMFVQSFPVGLGKDGSTPTGTWLVEPKNRIRHPVYYSARGEGVIEANDPKNPLGGYWIGLTGLDGQAVGKTSYGVHGTIDPNSIGKQESQGCIRLRADDIALLFDLLVEGKSKVIIKD